MSKQLTRNEIVELMKQAHLESSKGLKGTMEDILKALEKAGVLMLVEHKTKLPINYASWARSALSFIKYKKQENEFTDYRGGWKCPIDSEDIQRANTPTYQCAKEVTNE